jgi:hypothetical protein
MNKIRGAQKSSAIIAVGMAVAFPQKSKTTGGASPVVLEVYHKVEAGLPVRSAAVHRFGRLPDEFIHDRVSLVNKIFERGPIFFTGFEPRASTVTIAFRAIRYVAMRHPCLRRQWKKPRQ